MGIEIENRLYETNQVAAEFYRSYLMSEQGEKALAYLKSRNLTLDTIKTFDIGAAPDKCDGLMQHLKEKGYSVTEMAEAGLIMQNQNNEFSDIFRARIMFPITDVEGKVVAFSGRTFLKDYSAPIFLYTPETPICKTDGDLFGLNIAKKYGSEQIVLVEGILDAISLHQAGIRNGVAILGIDFTEEQAALLSKYTKKVAICFDSDVAGKRGAKQAAAVLKNFNIPTTIIALDDGMDPYAYVSKHRGEELKELIDIASNTVH